MNVFVHCTHNFQQMQPYSAHKKLPKLINAFVQCAQYQKLQKYSYNLITNFEKLKKIKFPPFVLRLSLYLPEMLLYSFFCEAKKIRTINRIFRSYNPNICSVYDDYNTRNTVRMWTQYINDIEKKCNKYPYIPHMR